VRFLVVLGVVRETEARSSTAKMDDGVKGEAVISLSCNASRKIVETRHGGSLPAGRTE
jgi:hypothetical protein